MRESIKIVEVGPRDGLQNEATILSLEDKVLLIQKLRKAGLRYIEIGAFVSPHWIPQMADTHKVCQEILSQKDKNACYSCLVPNFVGLEKALEAGVQEIAIFGSCTETFSKKNINCNIEESFKRFENVTKVALKNHLKVRGYLSVAFGCPYEGEVSFEKVLSFAKRMLSLGVYEISFGDTISKAHPLQVEEFLNFIKPHIPLHQIALHFHDTQNLALENVACGLEHGVRVFDSSVGGLGGCPYAKSSSGNLATEKLVELLEKKGFPTGVHRERLLEIKDWIHKKIR